LINTSDFDIQDGTSGNTIGCKTSGLLNKETERSGFESQSKLGRGLFGGRVGEDTLSLGELLVDVRDKTSGVSESVSVVHVVVNKLLVSGDILGGTQVGRGEDLAVFGDYDLALGADPWFPGSVRKLASFRGTSVGEFVGTIIKGNQDSGTRSVKSNKGGDLVTSLSSQKTSALRPDSHHGTDGPVVVNNGGSIQRIPADGEFTFATLIDVTDNRVFLGGTLSDDTRLLDGFPDESIGNHVNRKLCVSEFVGGVFDGDKSSSKGLGDVSTDIQHINDDLLDLLILALLLQDIVQTGVRVLLFVGGVERSRRGTVFSVELGSSTGVQAGRGECRGRHSQEGKTQELHDDIF